MTPDQLAAKAARMLNLFHETVSELDLRHVFTTLKGQAKNGDHQARTQLISLYGTGTVQPPPPPDEDPEPTVHVNVANNGRGNVSVVTIDGAGIRVVRLLATRGPLPPAVIAAECDVPETNLAELVQAEVLEYTPKGQLRIIPTLSESEKAND